MSRATIGDHDRMIASMVKTGHVVAVDLVAGKLRMQSGDWISPWVRWHDAAAGKARHWRAPSIGEEGTLLSPSGVPGAGRFFGGVFGTGGPAPDDREHVDVWDFPDGGRLVYDWQANTYDINLPSGTVTVAVGASTATVTDTAIKAKAASIKLTGEVEIIGPLRVSGDIFGAGKIIDAGGNTPNHKH